jgi:hypothetical protein
LQSLVIALVFWSSSSGASIVAAISHAQYIGGGEGEAA